MSATTLTLTIEPGPLNARSSWTEFESLAVEMSREVPLRALEKTLADAQERLIDSVCGPRWAPVRGLPAPFACPRCEMAEDFVRKGRRTRRRKLHTAVGTVELVVWNVGCRGCGRVFAPLLIMLGLSGKRRTDRLTVDLAELSTQVSFARAAGLSRQLAGTTATAGQAHNALADTAALLTGADGTLGPGHPSPDVVLFDGTGARAGTSKNGVGVHLALGLTGRSGPDRRRRAHTHLLGLTVGADWPALAAQLAGLPAPALVVLDGEAEITSLAGQLWPTTPIQRCWWHLPHGLRKAFYSDDAANRHVNPHWARHMSEQLGELLRDSIRLEQTTDEALATWDAFTEAIPDKLSSAHAYLAAARDHAFTCLDPDLRARLARLGGPELGTGVLERVMRELNARTDIGGSRWSIAGLRDLLTVHTARLLHHPTWKEIKRATHRPSTIPFRLQKFNA
ncbi:MAG: ISH6 family transposase [Pseudonocardiaceae bacterium]